MIELNWREGNAPIRAIRADIGDWTLTVREWVSGGMFALDIDYGGTGIYSRDYDTMQAAKRDALPLAIDWARNQLSLLESYQ